MDRLADCESGDRDESGAVVPGSARWQLGGDDPRPPWDLGLFDGGLQFHPDTWRAFRLDGMPDRAYDASREEQIEVARQVRDAQGWGAWPRCSETVGLR